MRTFTFLKSFFVFLVLTIGFTPLNMQASHFNDSILYVMIPYGGTNGFGVIATTDLAGGNYTIEHNFTGSDGKYPNADLFPASDGFFYGTAKQGGSADKGVIFKYDTANHTLTKLHDFNGTNGSWPFCTLIEAPNGKLYGTTWNGGANNLGSIFELDITVSPPVFSKKIDFNSTNGRASTNSLFLTSDGRIFGITPVGGAYQYGNIYGYDPATNTLTVLHDFNYSDGRNPYGSFLETEDGTLYGMTAAGGSNEAGETIDIGTIFSFDPADSSFSSLYTFNSSDGRTPWGNLMLHSNGNIYGMTRQGGSSDNGVIFKFDPQTSTVTKLYNMATGGAKGPLGTLFESANNKLYGLTERGGSSNAGTIFEFDPETNTFLKKLDFDWINGGIPQFNSFVGGGPDNNDGECDSDITNITATTCNPGQVGVTQQLFTNSFGCDSLVITTTTLAPSDTTRLDATTCNPGQVGVTQQLFTNSFGCDSLVITTTILAPSDTTRLDATTCDAAQVGVTQQLFTNNFGCDSLVIITTTLLPSDTTRLDATTCDPSQVGVSSQTYTNIFGCDSLVITTTVLETSPPVITVISDTITLWPPNHNYAYFELDDFVLSVSDNCEVEIYISHATSDEPETGGGSGNTTDDIVISGDCQSIDLRKERAGTGNGRVYTIHFLAEDEAGNTATDSCKVYVPQNEGGTALDDGAVYEVEGGCDNKSAFLMDNDYTENSKIISYPNPFTTSSTLEFTIEKSASATLKVYNSVGYLVSILFDDYAEAGQRYTVKFDGNKLPKGIYFYHLQTDQGASLMKKMILMK